MDGLRARRRTPFGSPATPSDAESVAEKAKLARRYVRLRRHHLALILAFVTLQTIALTYMFVHGAMATSSTTKTAVDVELEEAAMPQYDILVTVYAYDRPRHLLALLEDVVREANATALRVGVYVIDDGSLGCVGDAPSTNFYDVLEGEDSNVLLDVTSEYKSSADFQMHAPCAARARFSRVEALVRAQGWRMWTSYYRHGRRRYWHLVRSAHQLLRAAPRAEYYFFLPDDDRLCSNFFTRAIGLWQTIGDERKATLMLHVEATREHGAVWTNYKARRVRDGLWRVGWVESGNFLTVPRTLELLNWSFPRVAPQRWVDNPPISSGVGDMLSTTLVRAGKRLYRSEQSMVAHVGVKASQMNAEFRPRGVASLLTLYFADGDDVYKSLLVEAETIHASMASVWTRQASLHAAVLSLSHQVDRLHVHLNGYDAIPNFLRAAWITAELGPDMGDVGKFRWHPVDADYHLTVDDDIVYPADYAARLVRYRRTFDSPVAIGVHGISIIQERIDSGEGYYASRRVYMGVERVERRKVVHILGTGTLCYRTADVPAFDLNATFPRPNMADVWFGILAQRLKLPMVVMPHNASWLRELKGTFDDSIYVRSTEQRNADMAQTKAVKHAAPWERHYPS